MLLCLFVLYFVADHVDVVSYDVASGGVADRVVDVVVAVGCVDDVDVIVDAIGVLCLVYGWCANGIKCGAMARRPTWER